MLYKYIIYKSWAKVDLINNANIIPEGNQVFLSFTRSQILADNISDVCLIDGWWYHSDPETKEAGGDRDKEMCVSDSVLSQALF